MRKPKIGMIGLGSIAQKAYLPILTNSTTYELVGAYSPTASKRETICQAFRMESFTGLPELASSIDAAFVHSSTETHFEIVSYLLSKGIDVYVDKPLAATLNQGEQLVEQAERQGRKLMVGFNRRFAPMYQRVKEEGPFHTLDIAKHRGDGVRPVRYDITLLDDYLHVIDTLRFLAGDQLQLVSGHIEKTEANELHFARHLWKDQHGLHTTTMHRKAGVNHELVSTIRDGQRLTVEEMITLHRFEAGAHQVETFGSWDTLLTQRGFQGAIDHFISALVHDTPIATDGREALETQRLLTDLF